jgi:hypothetical protein
MHSPSYRILVTTAGIKDRYLAANILSHFGLREQQSIGDFLLDIRYQALTDEVSDSAFEPHFFIGAVLATRASASQLTMRTFASRHFQGKRASIHEDEVGIAENDWKAQAAACKAIVDALLDRDGGILWQSRYEELQEAVRDGDADMSQVNLMWLTLPEHMRQTA